MSYGWLVADGEAKLFDGDLEDYKSWIETRRPREAVAQPQVEKPLVKNTPKPNRKALQSKQKKLETTLASAQAELTEVNRQLADSATYASSDHNKISELNSAFETLDAKVAELEERWLELEIEIDA